MHVPRVCAWRFLGRFACRALFRASRLWHHARAHLILRAPRCDTDYARGLYGLGPVVLGIFVVAVYRLSRSEVTTLRQIIIALTAAASVAFSPVGIASTLVLAA